MRGICYLNIIRLHLLDYDPPVTEKSSLPVKAKV